MVREGRLRDAWRHLGHTSRARGGGPFVPCLERFLATWQAVTGPLTFTAITFCLLSPQPTMVSALVHNPLPI